MKIKARPSGKVIIPTKVVTIPTKEEVLLTLEVDFMVNVIDVVVKVIDPLKCKSYGENVGINVVIQGEFEQPQCGPKVEEKLMIRRTLCNKRPRSLF